MVAYFFVFVFFLLYFLHQKRIKEIKIMETEKEVEKILQELGVKSYS